MRRTLLRMSRADDFEANELEAIGKTGVIEIFLDQ